MTLRGACQIWRSMTVRDLEAVLAIEQRSHSHPWTHGNFVDSLACGHLAWVGFGAAGPSGEGGEGALRAYLVAMPGAGEMHLLNLTVAPDQRRRGLATRLLERLDAAARFRGDDAVWLEVRRSNVAAQQLYARHGFAEVGVRRAYYPSRGPEREDALVMKRPLPSIAHAMGQGEEGAA